MRNSTPEMSDSATSSGADPSHGLLLNGGGSPHSASATVRCRCRRAHCSADDAEYDGGCAPLVGYSTVMSAVAVMRKAGSLDQEKLIAAMANLPVGTPFGTATFRALDHQSTMGAYVGRIGLKDGKGVMTDWRFVDGKDALPSDEDIKKMRPTN